MIEVKNENPLKEGDKAYWFDSYGNLRGGQIAEIVTSDQTDARYAKVLLFKTYGKGMMPARLENCWPSKEACLHAEKQREDLQTAEYMESIKNVNDLVKFMYDVDITSEEPDYEAQAAVKHKALELLGVDLNQEYYPPDKHIKIENENLCKVGDKAWWFDSFGNKHNGIITDIYEGKTPYSENDKIATIESNSSIGARLADCWPSEEALLDADHRRSELQMAEYKDKVVYLSSLVGFMYNHDLHSEFRDYEAVAVVEERAKALLGIDLNEDADFTAAVESINESESAIEQ